MTWPVAGSAVVVTGDWKLVSNELTPFPLILPHFLAYEGDFMSHMTMEDVWKRFPTAGGELAVLQGAHLAVSAGDFTMIYGPSGSGKSTLLHILGGLDAPDAGRVTVDGRGLYEQTEGDLAAYRNHEVGFVFQFYHLLPEFTVEENVMLPALVGGVTEREARKRAQTLLDDVELTHRATASPQTLSGGEQQRAAIARALIQRPRVLLADEPTGNLDTTMGERIMGLLRHFVTAYQLTVIMVTHNRGLAQADDHQFALREGTLHAVA